MVLLHSAMHCVLPCNGGLALLLLPAIPRLRPLTASPRTPHTLLLLLLLLLLCCCPSLSHALLRCNHLAAGPAHPPGMSTS
jgi:hypothetical protein